MHRAHSVALRAFAGVLTLAVFAVPHLVVGQTAPPAVRNCLVVTMTGLRNARGLVRMGLYDTPSNWPRPDGAARSCVARIEGNSALCGFEPLRPGADYAIAGSHDENDNGRFDQNVLGAPLEGFAFTNDATPMLAAPSFDDCKIRYTGGIARVVMHAQY